MMTTKTLTCPICGRPTCQCMLQDREYLARQVGRLMRGRDGGPATRNGGFGAKNDTLVDTPEPPGSSTRGEDTDERYSPGWLVEMARVVLGAIDLDPASSALADQTVKAATFYTKRQDGLKHEWRGRVWLNFPWSYGFAPWASKFAEEWATGRMTAGCILSPGEMCWCIPQLPPGGMLWFPWKRPEFYDPTRKKWVGTRYPTWLAYYGPNTQKFAEVFGEYGRVYLGLTAEQSGDRTTCARHSSKRDVLPTTQSL